MGWKTFPLALLVSMAAILPAYADPAVIWKSSTSGQNKTAEAELLKFFVDNKVVVGVNVDSNAIANVVYDKALQDGCFNTLPELNSQSFLEAFRTDWKAGFRKKYRLTANTVSWEVFKQVGRQFGGFTICDQAENKIFIQGVKDKQQVATLQQQQQVLASAPMTPAEQAKSDALAAMTIDLESKIAGNTTAIGAHDKLILGLRTDVDTLKGEVTTLATDFGAVASRVGALEDRVGPIETTAGENSQAIVDINGTLTGVMTETAAAKAAAEKARETTDSFTAQIASILDVINQNSIWAVAAAVMAFFALILGIWRFFRRNKDESQERPNQMTGHADLPKSGKPAQSADNLFELNIPADKAL